LLVPTLPRTLRGLHRVPVGLALLLVLSLGLRASVYVGLSPFSSPQPGGYAYSLYEDWFQYVVRATLLPPLNYFIQALPIWLLGPERNAALDGNLIINFLMGTACAVTVYQTLRLARVPSPVDWLLPAALSTALVPFELWGTNYEGAHYDHPTPLFMALLGYALVRIAREGLTRRTIAIAAACAVPLMLQMATAAYFVPPLFVLIAIIERISGRLTVEPWRRSAALLAPVILVLIALSVKNGLVTGVGTPGARGGGPLMMFVQTAMGGDHVAVRQLAVEAGVPDWYLWCYDNRRLPPGQESVSQWDGLARAFGTCMHWATERKAGEPWPFDYSELIAGLNAFGRPDLAAIVEKDQADAMDRPFLLTGHSPELSPRWIAIYGQQSQRVGTRLLLSHPDLYFAAFMSNYRSLFWGRGPEFLATAGRWSARDYRHRDALKRFARFWFAAINRVAFLTLPIALLLSAAVTSLTWRRRRPTTEPLRLYLNLALPVGACVLFYAGAVSIENDRYFVHIMPLLVIHLGLAVSHISTWMAGDA
jgi:hypothetical protein